MASFGISGRPLSDRGTPPLPWGLSEYWWTPAKIIRDPVEKDVAVLEIERLIIDSPPLRRLRRTRQLGMTHEVYPGATHTRFAHSIGTVQAAHKLVNIVLEQRVNIHAVPDVFAEWEKDLTPEVYKERVLEVKLLARLGALLHDISHVPYGHSIEDDLGILEAHDANVPRFEHLWTQLREHVSDYCERSRIPDDLRDNLTTNLFSQKSRLYQNVRPLILSKERDERGEPLAPPHERIAYPFVADIVGNTICADLLDYLVRDHMYAGLPMELGDRFLSAFFVTPAARQRNPERMALSIVRDGRERTDVISELLKHLRYRYEETERVLTHHAKLSADAMVGKLLEMWRDRIEETLPVKERFSAAATSSPAERAVARKHTASSRKIEYELLARSDDGILEYLRDYCDGLLRRKTAPIDKQRVRGMRALVAALLDGRMLFKPVDRVSTQQGEADAIYTRYGSPEERRGLEMEAARYAEIRPAWHLLLWLPPPAMRLKQAEVLVYDGSSVNSFVHTEAYASKRGTDIYEAHRRLWGITLYAHWSVTQEQHEAARLYLARQMEVRWDKMAHELGTDTASWPDAHALREAVAKRGGVSIAQQREWLSERVARPPAEGIDTHEGLILSWERFIEASLGTDDDNLPPGI